MELETVLANESPLMPVDVLVELAQAAEDLGYATAWLPDHVLPPGEFGGEFGGVYEALVTIAHLAAVTERLRLGTSVLVAPLRNPFLLAKQVATLHRLSSGRVILGLGVGWAREEFDALGVDYSRRGAITDDVLALLSHLFGGGSAPYRGRRFSYDQGVFAPIPDGRVPIMVGGNSDAALRRAARYGDVWQAIPTSPTAFSTQARTLAELARGREVVPALRIRWDGTLPVQRVADDVIAYLQAGAARVAIHFGQHGGTHRRMEALAEKLADR